MMRGGLVSGLLTAALALALGSVPAGAAGTGSAAAGPPSYVFTDVGVLGGLDSRAYALSPSGYVAGLGDTSPDSWIFGYHAFRWSPTTPGATTGTILDLGALTDTDLSAAAGVNSAGIVVGQSLGINGGNDAFIYGDSMRALPGLGGRISNAEDINNHGQAVGSARAPKGRDHAVMWLLPGGAEGPIVSLDLGIPHGWTSSGANAINEHGRIAGGVAKLEGGGFAALWTPRRPHGTRGTWRVLGTLRGGWGSFAEDINRHGVVVGQAVTHRGDRGWVWDGHFHPLRPLPGGDATYAFAVNDAGDVVGYSNLADFTARAVLFRDGTTIDLNDWLPQWAVDAGYLLISATGINNHGQIVGVAAIGEHAHGFLLTPVS